MVTNQERLTRRPTRTSGGVTGDDATTADSARVRTAS